LASGPDWTGAENLAPTGIRSPDRTARTDYATRPTICTFMSVLFNDGVIC